MFIISQNDNKFQVIKLIRCNLGNVRMDSFIYLVVYGLHVNVKIIFKTKMINEHFITHVWTLYLITD